MLLPAKGMVMWFPTTTNCVISLRSPAGKLIWVSRCNLTNHSHTHPADLNFQTGSWASQQLLSITIPLNPSTLLEASVTTGVAALTTELRKHTSNDTKCKELDWVYVPLVVESYGVWGRRLWSLSPSLLLD